MQVLKSQSLQMLFLGRLARMVLKETTATTSERVLLAKSILSTYRDCRELGVESEARRILSARQTLPWGDA